MLEAIGKIQMNVHVEGANKGGYHVSNTSASLKKENTPSTPSTPPGKRATSLAYSPAKSETHTGGYVPLSQTRRSSKPDTAGGSGLRSSSESRISKLKTTPAASSP